MYKDESADNFHDSSVFENQNFFKTNEQLLYLTNDVLLFSSSSSSSSSSSRSGY